MSGKTPIRNLNYKMRGWETILFLFGTICGFSRKKTIMNRDLENVVKAVAEVMDLSPCQILCRRKFPETIDAKWMVVYLLKERGHYSGRIAEWIGMTARNVNRIVSVMNLPKMDKFGHKLEMARKYLRNMEM